MYPYSTAPGTLTNVKSSSTPIHVVGTMVPLFRLMYWTLEALTFILMSVQIKSDEVVKSNTSNECWHLVIYQTIGLTFKLLAKT